MPVNGTITHFYLSANQDDTGFSAQVCFDRASDQFDFMAQAGVGSGYGFGVERYSRGIGVRCGVLFFQVNLNDFFNHFYKAVDRRFTF